MVALVVAIGEKKLGLGKSGDQGGICATTSNENAGAGVGAQVAQNVDIVHKLVGEVELFALLGSIQSADIGEFIVHVKFDWRVLTIDVQQLGNNLVERIGIHDPLLAHFECLITPAIMNRDLGFGCGCVKAHAFGQKRIETIPATGNAVQLACGIYKRTALLGLVAEGLDLTMVFKLIVTELVDEFECEVFRAVQFAFELGDLVVPRGGDKSMEITEGTRKRGLFQVAVDERGGMVIEQGSIADHDGCTAEQLAQDEAILHVVDARGEAFVGDVICLEQIQGLRTRRCAGQVADARAWILSPISSSTHVHEPE